MICGVRSTFGQVQTFKIMGLQQYVISFSVCWSPMTVPGIGAL